MTAQPRSIAVIGAGGVGGLIAAMLARGGHDVRLLARGAALVAIRDHGVRLLGTDGESSVRLAQVSDDPGQLGVADIIIVTVKTWQLAELGPRLVPVMGPRTVVLPLQNGVEASEQLAAALGEPHVIGGVARVISWIEQPGVIRSTIPPGLTIGALRPDQAEAVETCAAALRVDQPAPPFGGAAARRQAPGVDGIEVAVSPAIQVARWTKLVFIAPYGAIGAVERVPVGTIRTTPALRARLEASMHEVAAVAAARGVPLPADTLPGMLQLIDRIPAESTASMHRDIAEGRPSELHELIGAVVRLGRQAGVATPVSAALYAQLEPFERKARGG
jgi:2-dehydropantoate 2-reductase